jgi:hypothetical protein
MFKGILYIFYILSVLIFALAVFGGQWRELSDIFSGFNLDYVYSHPPSEESIDFRSDSNMGQGHPHK